MTYQQLDLLFPWVVFIYGVVLTLTLNSPRLMAIADKKFSPELIRMMNAHRFIGLISLFIGCLWTLQNLLLS